MMFFKTLYDVLTVAVLAVLVSFSMAGEIYQWTDEKGTVHFTDDASKIPGLYSDRARKMEVPVEKGVEEEKAIRPDQSQERVKRYLKDLERRIEMKKRVENNLSGLEKELGISEERLKRIEDYEKGNYLIYQPFRDPKTGKWVPVASPYFEEKKQLIDRIKSIKEEMKSLKEELYEINRSL